MKLRFIVEFMFVNSDNCKWQKKPVKPAFQRVQVDKIQFTDERLQDNSYWAKV